MLARTIMGTVAALALTAGLTGAAWADPVTIRIVSKDLLTTNPEDVAHIDRIEKAMAAQGTDINIEIVDLPSAGYADKLGLMLLSGDIPDLIYFQGGDEQFANQGVLEDWRPWIAKTKYLKAGLWPHNEKRLENYPYLLYPFPARTKSAVIRKDWLDQLGGTSPESLDDWTAMLKAASTTDLNGDGTNDTYGILAPDNTAEMDAIFDKAFGVTATWMQNDNGEWINSRVSDAERNKLAYYQSLFADGVLDPEFVTTNWELKEDKFYSGKVAVVMGTAGPVVDIYRTKMQQVNPGTELALLDPPAGVEQGLQAVDVSKESRGWAMSSLSEHKEAVVALMDFLAGPEGQMFERMGFEGEHYTKDGDTYAITDQMGTWYPRFMMVNPDAWTAPTDLLSPVAQASLAQGAEYFTPDNAFVWPADYAAEVDAAENYYRSSVYRFVSGEWSMDKWDDYVKGWNDVGGAHMTEYARSVL